MNREEEKGAGEETLEAQGGRALQSLAQFHFPSPRTPRGVSFRGRLYACKFRESPGSWFQWSVICVDCVSCGDTRSSGEAGLGKTLPGRVIGPLRMVERESRRTVGPAAFDHERHRALDLVRLQLSLAGALPAGDVRAVAGHQIVEAHSARRETVRLRVIIAIDQAHELAHHVAVEPGWPERVFGNHP